MSDQVRIINEMKGLELLPILTDMLVSVNKGELSVKDLNNSAGKIRVRLNRFKSWLGELEGIQQTPEERQKVINQLKGQMSRKNEILAGFAESINEKLGAANQATVVEAQGTEAAADEDVEMATDDVLGVDICKILREKMQVDQGRLEEIVALNNREMVEEKERLAREKEEAREKEKQRKQDELEAQAKKEQESKDAAAAAVAEGKKQSEAKEVADAGIGDKNPDDMFGMDFDTGFDMEEFDKPAEEQKTEEKQDEGNKGFNEESLNLNDFNLNDIPGDNEDDNVFGDLEDFGFDFS